MSDNRCYEEISSSKYVAAPGSGATITLYDSNVNVGTNRSTPHRGLRYKHVTVSGMTSHSSAANGLRLFNCFDGTTFETAASQDESVTGGTEFKFDFTPSAPRWKITYENDTNVLTTWRFSIEADTNIP